MPPGVGYGPKAKSLMKGKGRGKKKKPDSGPLGEDSPSVSKEEYKRLHRIFSSVTGKHGLSDIEVNNAFVMMKSNKNFTNEEIKELATNPHGKRTSKGK
jgi:hypothetical protein